MSIRSGKFWILAALALLGAAPATPVCSNRVATSDGYFYTFYRDSGSGCLTLGRRGRYAVEWHLGERGNLVVGKGWRTGATDRVIVYKARRFDPGRNGYLALYGWSIDPLVEYYVVDNWGGFTPPGNAVALGSIESDGGTYRLYRTTRVNQPSIAGSATFDQYWSVRTARRPMGRAHTITFRHHVDAWAAHGLRLGRMEYQVLAIEGFGSDGDADVTVWQR